MERCDSRNCDLSLGQWQPVAIARGLFRKHDLILLDESTASIDPLEEQGGLRAVHGDRRRPPVTSQS